MSLREVVAQLEGQVENRRARAVMRRWEIWHGAALMRAKALPDMKKFVDPPRHARRQSRAELQAAFDVFAAMVR